MRTRKRLMFVIAGLLGAAVVVLPSIAGSATTPTIKATGGGIYVPYWLPPSAEVSPGGVVALSNSSKYLHGVEWVAGPGGAKPSCTGVPVGSQAEPEPKAEVSWSGSCTFTTPGEYVFYCTVHGKEMSATVRVVSPGETTTTTTGTTTPPPGSTTTSTTGTPPPPNESGGGTTLTGGIPSSPFAGGVAKGIKLRSSQHGNSVHGSVAVSQAGAHGQLEVDLLAANASLAAAGHIKQTRVGRMLRKSLATGNVSFSVALSAKAKRALERHGRLALTVRIALKPVGGMSVTAVRHVLLRPAS